MQGGGEERAAARDRPQGIAERRAVGVLREAALRAGDDGRVRERGVAPGDEREQARRRRRATHGEERRSELALLEVETREDDLRRARLELTERGPVIAGLADGSEPGAAVDDQAQPGSIEGLRGEEEDADRGLVCAHPDTDARGICAHRATNFEESCLFDLVTLSVWAPRHTQKFDRMPDGRRGGGGRDSRPSRA